ncbi:MAG: hypothetical protein KZQ66_21480 [Candidatus Thiodiazotropha sp. (ex Lucinoma aequizonata)]|nr:hypothetical protein [Candidatus Thiodiazotropha sp. (ex Lucinoma aequizonata)]
MGYPVSRNKARKLMREAGVSVKQRKRYKVTTNSNHKQQVFKYRLLVVAIADRHGKRSEGG